MVADTIGRQEVGGGGGGEERKGKLIIVVVQSMSGEAALPFSVVGEQLLRKRY